MVKYIFGIVLLICVSCGNKEDVLLPIADSSIVKEVSDLSPIYMFFRVKGKDTLVEVNRKNSIITTNWIFNIDKRLPLRTVISEVMKLQQKKREEKEHRNELALNYYSYADKIGKNLAFIPFTEVYYKMEHPKFGVIIFFTKGNEIHVNNITVKRELLKVYLDNLQSDKPNKFVFCFAKDLSYESYIQNEIFIRNINLKIPTIDLKREEFIY